MDKSDAHAKNKGGRPPKEPGAKLGSQIALRLDPQLLSRLDAHVRRLQGRQPAVVWTRGSAIRELMMTALALAEQQDGVPVALPSTPPPAPAARPSVENVLATIRDRMPAGRAARLRIADVRDQFSTAPGVIEAALLALEHVGRITLHRDGGPSQPAVDARDRESAVICPRRGSLYYVSLGLT